MPNTISPNMGLLIPTVGQEPGPTWASDINASLNYIDQHNHAPGSGVQINPNGISINADLPFNNFNILTPRTIRFYPQASTWTPGVLDLDCLLTQDVDLYYIDGNGNLIRITQSGSVAGAAGTITGLPSGTASAAYGAGNFVFQSATNVAANISGASYLLHNSGVGSFTLTLSPPTAMTADFPLVLPSLPAATSFLTLDTSGNIAGSTVYPLTAAGIANSAVGTLQIADHTVTQIKKAIRVVTTNGSDPGAGGMSTSASSGAAAYPGTRGTLTNMSVTLTTTGNPVYVGLVSDGTATAAYLQLHGSPTYARTQTWINRNTSGDVAQYMFQVSRSSSDDRYDIIPSTTIYTIDTPAAGTHTWIVQGVVSGTGASGVLAYSKLIVYEQ